MLGITVQHGNTGRPKVNKQHVGEPALKRSSRLPRHCSARVRKMAQCFPAKTAGETTVTYVSVGNEHNCRTCCCYTPCEQRPVGGLQERGCGFNHIDKFRFDKKAACPQLPCYSNALPANDQGHRNEHTALNCADGGNGNGLLPRSDRSIASLPTNRRVRRWR